MFSVRDDLASDFEGTIKAVAGMGYDGVEFAGLYGHTPAEAKAVCDRYGVKIVSIHSSLEELSSDPEGFVKDFASSGCENIVITYLLEDFRAGHPRFGEVIEGAKVIGGVCNRYGLNLLYHNHDFDFAKVGGDYALDVLYREVPAELLKSELDTCWIDYVGVNPAEYIRKYAGRAPVIHLKDFVMPGKKSEKGGPNVGIDGIEFDKVESFWFRPVGYGVLNVDNIVDAARFAGTKWLVVEQDMPALGKSALECAQMSVEFLKKTYG